jgi:hypothetical protein
MVKPMFCKVAALGLVHRDDDELDLRVVVVLLVPQFLEG